MTHATHVDRQQDILERATALLQASPHVLCLVLTGSVARGENDAFSDVDVGCYLRSEDRTGREELYNRVGELAPLLCKLWLYDVHALYLYTNGVRLDLDFMRPSDLTSASYVYATMKVLYDPAGVLQGQLAIRAIPWPADHPKWFEPGSPDFTDWFFWMFRQIVCWSRRAAQGDDRTFDKLSNAADSVGEVRTRLKEMRLWTLGKQDYLARADPECACNLAATFPHFDPGEMVACARRLLDEYERICPSYCQKSLAAYPVEKFPIIRRLITEYEALD